MNAERKEIKAERKKIKAERKEMKEIEMKLCVRSKMKETWNEY